MAHVDVRLTMNPGLPVRMQKGNVPELAYQGLLVTGPVPADDTPPGPAARRRRPRRSTPGGDAASTDRSTR